jgi:hypothetical protein
VVECTCTRDDIQVLGEQHSRDHPPRKRDHLVPILALVRIRCAVVRAFGGVGSALAPDRMARDGMLVGLLLIASFGLSWAVDTTLVMLSMVISSLFALGCATFAMRRQRSHFTPPASPEYDAATWRRSAIPLVILAGTEALLNRTGWSIPRRQEFIV